MKKLIALILIIALAAPVALADIDLSGMTFDELMDLQQQLTAALWASDGWQEVEVPVGYYVVGDDIPAGRWSVTSDGYIFIRLYSSLKQYLAGNDWIGGYGGEAGSKVNLTLADGEVLEVVSTPIIFTPGTSLGFK